MSPLVGASQGSEVVVILAVAAAPFVLVSAVIWFVLRPFDKSNHTPVSHEVGQWRLRPFGLAGSAIEVFIGLALMKSVLWADEAYSQSLMIVVAGAGLVVLLAGLAGVVAYFGARSHVRA